MKNKLQERREKFMPNGIPKMVRIYDNGGETCDRYTVVFTGRYRRLTGGEFWVLGMSGAPYHPQGFCQHSFYNHQIDVPRYGHLGKKIKFTDLPKDCQRAVLEDYEYLWDLTDEVSKRQLPLLAV